MIDRWMDGWIDGWMDRWMDRLGQVIDSDRFLPLLPLGASDRPIGLPWPVRIDLWAHPCFPPVGTPGTPG